MTKESIRSEIVTICFRSDDKYFDFNSILKNENVYVFLNKKIIKNNTNNNYPKFTYIINYLRNKKYVT